MKIKFRNLLTLLFGILTGMSQAQNIPTKLPGYLSNSEIPASIQRAEQSVGIYAIYPGSGVPNGTPAMGLEEKTNDSPMGKTTRNISMPTVQVFLPKSPSKNNTAVIIAPGGAFYIHAMEKEGYEVAQKLTEEGYTCFVLKYRLASTPASDEESDVFLGDKFSKLPQQQAYEILPPVGNKEMEAARLLAEEDGRQAIRFVRQNAQQFGIDPQKIGIMGFSAGGGVAVNATLEADTLSKPNFVGGIYAGWRPVESPVKNLPPLFLAIADHDILVTPVSSSRLFELWHQQQAPVELHIFQTGEHGFGSRTNETLTDSWVDLYLKWLKSNGF